MRLLFADDFNRGTLGSPWTADGSVSLASNEMHIDTPGHLATVAGLAADGVIQVTALAGASGAGPVSSLVFRFLDPSNFWYVYHYIDGGNLQIRKVIAGSDSAAFVAGAVPGAGSLVYKVTLAGAAVLLEIDGTPYINDVMSGPDAALTATWTGGGCRASSTGCVFDDFSVTAADAAAADTASGADAASLSAAGPPGSDTGAGADSVSLSTAASGSDTAAVADAAVTTSALSAAESGADTEAGAVAASATRAEVATGVDAGAGLAVVITAAELGAGVDGVASLLTSEARVVADIGAGADVAATSATLTASDTATMAEAASTAALLTAAEVAAALDLVGAVETTSTGPVIRMVPGFLFSGRL